MRFEVNCALLKMIEERKKKLAAELQARGFEIGTHVPVGEYVAPSAVRKGIKGLVVGPGDFYWNIRKEQ